MSAASAIKAVEWTLRAVAALEPIGSAIIKALTGGQTIDEAIDAMNAAAGALASSPTTSTRRAEDLERMIDGLPADSE